MPLTSAPFFNLEQMTMVEKDEDYFLPLEDQRVFGAGLKRKRVPFVPASAHTSSLPPGPVSVEQSVENKYLSIVFPKPEDVSESTPSSPNGEAGDSITPAPELCPICNLPLRSDISLPPKAHETSIAHQVCLSHSRPPSHLDPSHIGVKYLSSYGWDPDSRSGLGARGDGIRAPIKARVKNDTVGLGVKNDDEDTVRKPAKKRKEQIMKKMNAKQVKQHAAAEKRRAEKLRDLFYGKDLEKYLGLG